MDGRIGQRCSELGLNTYSCPNAISIFTSLVDLKPDSSCSRAISRAVTGAFGHIRDQRAFVGIWPLRPDQADGATGCRWSGEWGWCGREASVCIAVALYVDEREILNWAIAGNLAVDSLRGRAHVWVGVRVVECWWR